MRSCTRTTTCNALQAPRACEVSAASSRRAVFAGRSQLGPFTTTAAATPPLPSLIGESNDQRDSSSSLSAFQVADGVGCLNQWEVSVHQRCDLPCFEQGVELQEYPRMLFDDEGAEFL